MNKLVKLFAFVLLCFSASSSALADATPEATLKIIVKKMQESHINVLEFVHWPSAFNSLAPREKQSLRVKNAEEMKNFYMSMHRDPRAFYERQLKGKIGNLTQEQQAVVDQQINQTVSVIEKKIESQQERMRNSKYVVGQAKVTGNKAEIPITATYNGDTRKEKVDLVNVNGQWMLPQLALIKGKKRRPINSTLPPSARR